MDTRTAPNRVGVADTFTTDDTKAIAAHGTNGDCTIPAEAVGLSLNATAVDASTATFITIWSEGTRPPVSSLNPGPGQRPTPNAVVTALSPAGSFMVYTLAGTVDLIIDINGYYTKTSLIELTTRLATTEGKIAANATAISDNATNTGANAADVAQLDLRERTVRRHQPIGLRRSFISRVHCHCCPDRTRQRPGHCELHRNSHRGDRW
jgi:hypothetical protein